MIGESHGRRRFKLKAGEYNWYKEQVAKDPEFLSSLKALAALRVQSFPEHNSAAIRESIATLAVDYDLSIEDVDELLVAVINGATLGNSRGSVGIDLVTRQITVTYSIDHCGDTEAKELLKRSLDIRRRDFGKPKGASRALPQDPELLYAVHRAYSRGLSRETIYARYAEGSLTEQAPNLAQYPTPKVLLDYYYRHTQPAHL